MSAVSPASIIAFWFSPRVSKLHWGGPPAFDQELRDSYLEVHTQICEGQHRPWLEAAEGSLATIIVLDQFSRNMFRNTSKAFATDGLARWVLMRALDRGQDRSLPDDHRHFMYMPLMHSESSADQQRCIELMATLKSSNNLRFCYLHKDIIDRFGRFPHRNQALGRVSTPDELAFLQQPGSSF